MAARIAASSTGSHTASHLPPRWDTMPLCESCGPWTRAALAPATTDVVVLIKRKPHLAARRPTGDVGHGARPEAPEIGLAAMLRRGS